jgi:selenocysteine lyase/cysteine desulfurase
VTGSTTAPTNWRDEWFEFQDATYLNAAGQGPMPRASLMATQAALEWKKFPHKTPESAYFGTANDIRVSIATLIGGRADEIAITTGASGGLAAVAFGLSWQPGDEVVTTKGEFPVQMATWKPLEAREGIRLRVVVPQGRFVVADDLVAALTPRTKLVSVSLVRFDDGSLLNAARVASACHAQGALLLLDVSQCCGAIPFDIRQLGADFAVCAGYKWLLSPYGTGFFWVRSELIDRLRPAPFYWMAIRGADRFHSLVFEDPEPASGARRWDAPETSSYFNLAGMKASLEFVLRVGPETVARHNRALIERLFRLLPADRYVAASPLDPAHRGPYGCFAARSPEGTSALHERLARERVVVSLREGNLRVSPHLYNDERDIDRLIEIVTA